MVLWDESWNFSWWTLPDATADVMTILVMAGCLYFLVRRVSQPEVKFVTDWSDYMLLAIVAAPFVTGFIAYHQLFGINWMTIVHMLCGEIMLAAIPFTRLVHMVFSPLTRAYMGSEFGKVRHARDW
jgi:nitrate reductase gamma subunit